MPELLLFGLLLVVLVGIAIATLLRPGFDDEFAIALDRLMEPLRRRAGIRQAAAGLSGLGASTDEIRRRLRLAGDVPPNAPSVASATGSRAAWAAMPAAATDGLVAVAAAPALDVEPGEPRSPDPPLAQDSPAAEGPSAGQDLPAEEAPAAQDSPAPEEPPAGQDSPAAEVPRPPLDAPSGPVVPAAGLFGRVAEAGRSIAGRLFGGDDSTETPASRSGADAFGDRSTADPELEETRPPAVYRQILRGDRAVLDGVASALAGTDPIGLSRWGYLLDRLFGSIERLALDAGYLDPPRAQPFWAAFTPDQGRDVMKALGSLGYRFDGQGGWQDGRAPTRRDLSIAVGYAGVDPVRMRTWPDPEELEALAGQVTIAGAEFLEVVAPALTLAEVSGAVEPLDPSGELSELWLEWDRVRPLLLAEG